MMELVLEPIKKGLEPKDMHKSKVYAPLEPVGLEASFAKLLMSEYQFNEKSVMVK